MQYAQIQQIIVYRGRHFVCQLGICNPICVKLLRVMCSVIMHNSVKKNEVYINKMLSFSQNYSVSRPPFFRHLGICNRIYVQLLQLMYGVIMHNVV